MESCDGSFKYQIGHILLDPKYMMKFSSCYGCPNTTAEHHEINRVHYAMTNKYIPHHVENHHIRPPVRSCKYFVMF